MAEGEKSPSFPAGGFHTGCVPPAPAWIAETRARLKREREDALARAEERVKAARAEEAEREAREARELRDSDPHFHEEQRALHAMSEAMFRQAAPDQMVWIELCATRYTAALVTFGVSEPYSKRLVTVTMPNAHVTFEAEQAAYWLPGPPGAVKSSAVRGALAEDFSDWMGRQGKYEGLRVAFTQVGTKSVRVPGRDIVLMGAEGKPPRGLTEEDWVILVSIKLE